MAPLRTILSSAILQQMSDFDFVCLQQVSLLITRVGIFSCVDRFVSKPFKMWEREIWNLNVTLNMPRHIQSQEYWIWDDSHIQAFDCDCPTFKRHIRLMWLNQLNLNMNKWYSRFKFPALRFWKVFATLQMMGWPTHPLEAAMAAAPAFQRTD